MKRWLLAFVAVLALSLEACAPDTLPEHIQPVGFSAAEVEVLHDVHDHYCRATGWCPDFYGWGTDIRADYDYARWDWTTSKHSIAHNAGGAVNIDMVRIDGDLGRLWYAYAHEVWHWARGPHLPWGLAAESYDGTEPLCLDIAAVMTFCEASQQCTREETTCAGM
jgi:hypothetical protein